MSWSKYEIVLDKRTLCDLECILNKSFYPLETFMNEDNYISVLTNMSLKNGDFFPLPINLSIKKDIFEKKNIKTGVKITLSNEYHYPIADMLVQDYYEPNIDEECKLAYGTNDLNHPYVKYKMTQKDSYYVSGKLSLINKVPHSDFLNLRKTPDELKEIFRKNKWTTIIGFQTRNPMHKSHYELTKYALNKVKQENSEHAKLLIHPVVGITQENDIEYTTRIKCYEEVIKHYPENSVYLSLLPLSMRMAGPKEACFHALIRKNYGCTHFIVGRDHAGPSTKKQDGTSFYGEYDAQKLLFQNHEKINIQPIVSTNIIYNKNDNKYYPESSFPKDGEKCFVSGTKFRKMIKNNETVPSWFSFEKVIEILKRNNKDYGVCFYFIGLPCSGKTTHALKLYEMIKEKYPEKEITLLDGDEVRNHLSKGLGFSEEDRSTNVKRIGWVASKIVKHNGIVICSNIAPFEKDRKYNRELITNTGGRYIEIYVDTDISVCESRDIKGLYKKARLGEIKNFTGIDSEFQEPENYDIKITNNKYDLVELVNMI